MIHFEVLTEITDIEEIAVNKSIQVLPRLKKQYGEGRWRKLKGYASVQLGNGIICKAELHW